jgi:uncharacterized membrane protein
LWAWGRNKVFVAGLVMGLAISARSYPLVLLVAIGLLAVRSGKVGAWARMAVTTLLTLFAVSLPWVVMNADGLFAAYRTWWRSGPSYGSLWLVSGLLGHGLQDRVTTLVLLGWLAALVVGAFFALAMNRRPTVAEVSLVMLVIVVVTGKAMPVQAALWLLPLIALVGLRWRDHLIWAGFEAVYFVAVWLYIAGLSKPERGMPAGLYSVLTLFRVAAWLYVLVQVWRVARAREPVNVPGSIDEELLDQQVVQEEPRDPEPVDREPVDQGADLLMEEEVDPLAGPMAGAPDQLIVRVT